MSEKCHLLGKFIAVYSIVIDTKDILSKLVLNSYKTDRNLMQRACSNTSKVNLSGSLRARQVDSTSKDKPNTHLLQVLSGGCQLLAVHMHQNPPPDSLPTSISCPSEVKQAPAQGPLCFLPSSFSCTVAFLCLM